MQALLQNTLNLAAEVAHCSAPQGLAFRMMKIGQYGVVIQTEGALVPLVVKDHGVLLVSVVGVLIEGHWDVVSGPA